MLSGPNPVVPTGEVDKLLNLLNTPAGPPLNDSILDEVIYFT